MSHGSTDYYNPDVQLASALSKLDDSITELTAIAGKFDTSIGKLTDVISKLDDQITKLASIDTNTTFLTKADNAYANSGSIGFPQVLKVLSARAGRTVAVVTGTHATVPIYVGYTNSVSQLKYAAVLVNGSSYSISGYTGEVYIYSHSANSTWSVWETYYS